MAIRQIPEVRSDLPAARLFLDDVQAITLIIAQLPGVSGSNTDPSTIKYIVGDRECDTCVNLVYTNTFLVTLFKLWIPMAEGWFSVGLVNTTYTPS